jgi:hypothetical protein
VQSAKGDNEEEKFVGLTTITLPSGGFLFHGGISTSIALINMTAWFALLLLERSSLCRPVRTISMPMPCGAIVSLAPSFRHFANPPRPFDFD